MDIKTVSITPFGDQKPGTSGLRKKTKYFMQPHYIEAFVQAAVDAVRGFNEADYTERPLVVGGDGRFYNREAIQKIVKIALANGYRHVMVGKAGILSTPATSAVIRARKASGGFILSASHNPGGAEHDFGIKYNTANGAPSPEKVTEKIYLCSKELSVYKICDIPDIDLDQIKTSFFDGAKVEVFDPLLDYTDLMQQLFDFGEISALFRSGFRMCYDAMNAVTGPYAKRIIEDLIGAPAGTVIRAMPLEDFGGLHPDPNQVHAHELMEKLWGDEGLDFGAASDGDGDRNMILGKKVFVSPGDSLAIITEYAAKVIPGYKKGLSGVARSMPTSRAVDTVAKAFNVPCYEVPTGWKFFGNLMDAGKCAICGEESFGTGSDHVREKDGLWAVLCWLQILANTKKSVAEIVEAHWAKFGRWFYQRHDHEGLDAEKANVLINELRGQIPSLIGTTIGGQKVTLADDYAYTDPIDNSLSTKQGIRIYFGETSRVIFRLSGTGTEGATLRIYYEKYGKDCAGKTAHQELQPLIAAVRSFLRLHERFGKEEPDVVT